MSAVLAKLGAIFLAVWQLMPFSGPRWVEPSNAITRAVYGPYSPRLQREPRNAYEELVFGPPPAARTGPEAEWPDGADADVDWDEERENVGAAQPDREYVDEEREERPAAKHRRGAA